jgi:hypothetical protein
MRAAQASFRPAWVENIENVADLLGYSGEPVGEGLIDIEKANGITRFLRRRASTKVAADFA